MSSYHFMDSSHPQLSTTPWLVYGTVKPISDGALSSVSNMSVRCYISDCISAYVS